MAQIKGFTVELDGNTLKLQKALKQVNTPISTLQSKLRQVENAMRFDKYNPELIAQKQKYLNQAVEETQNKLKKLKAMQQQAAEAMKRGVEGSEDAYDRLTREIIQCEQELMRLNIRVAETSNLAIMGQRFADIGSKITDMSNKMRGVSMAASALVASLGAIAYKAATAADDLNTMSKVYSISTRELQKYKYAADLVDVSVETIATSHIRLEKTMNTAKKGTGTAAEAYKALGVSITDATGGLRDADSVWQDVILALGKMENEAQRDAYAMQLMGKSAADLNPLIEDNGETFKKIAKIMEDYDLDFIDQKTLDKANEFNDSLDTMKLLGSVALANVGSNLASYLAPALEKVVKLFGKFTKYLGNLSPKLLTTIGLLGSLAAVAAPVTAVIGFMFTGIGNFLGVLAKAPATVVKFGKALSLLAANPVVLVIAGIAALGLALVALYKNCESFRNGVNKIIDDIKPILEDFRRSVNESINEIRPAIETLKQAFSDLWAAVGPLISTAIEAIGQILIAIMPLVTFATNILAPIITSVVTLITRKIETIAKVATIVVNAFVSTFNRVSEVRGKISSGLNSALSTARGFVSKFTSIGRNIITGIVNGIKSAASSVANALSGVVNNAVNAVKRKLGIRSPSRVFRDQVGIQIPAGIAAGVNKGAGIALKSVGGLADNLTGAAKVATDVEYSAKVGQSNNATAIGSNATATAELLEEFLPKLLAAAKKEIYLDGKTLVGGTIGEINNKLGTIGQRQERGSLV